MYYILIPTLESSVAIATPHLFGLLAIREKQSLLSTKQKYYCVFTTTIYSTTTSINTFVYLLISAADLKCVRCWIPFITVATATVSNGIDATSNYKVRTA